MVDGRGAAGVIRARKLSPVELMNALLDRIDRLDPKPNVFIRLDREAAPEAAKAAEAELAAGRRCLRESSKQSPLAMPSKCPAIRNGVFRPYW